MNETVALATPATHPKTGLPVESVPAFQVGDLVTEHFMSDGYPAVVVAATPKTLWVRRVEFVGNFSAADSPGYNGYGDSGTIAVDPESVEQAVKAGKEGATKYVLRVGSKPSTSMSLREQEQYGSTSLHRAKWGLPGSHAGSLSAGAKYRQDPHR